ncbi:MFS transporter [Tsukamurella ocularis]|uniref:MFS transporter n=1 Tax=Tsukamurella ocularis TaxID=1970234 RepID=UPI0039F02300
MILALFLTAYEGQLAPILSLMLKDLGFSKVTYGLITAASLLVGAFAGYIGGRLADRIGRVRLLVPFLFLSGVAVLFMASAQNVQTFTVARIVLALVEGIAVSGTQPLVRDFTPRVGRAQAFAFWSWGSVVANLVAAGVAAATLGFFDDNWRSQLIIMGIVSIAGSLVVACTLHDLSPELRRQIRRSEHEVTETRAPLERLGVRPLIASPVIWLHVLANGVLFILLGTLNAYGQTMVEETFGVTVRQASAVLMAFWFANTVTSLVAARISDRTQQRIPFMVGGGVTGVLSLVVWVALMTAGSAPFGALVLVQLLMGASIGAVYGPWMASFSAAAEEVHPDLQGTAFGLNHFISRILVLGSVVLAPRVADFGGWRPWMIVTLVAMVVYVVLAVLLQRWGRRRSAAARVDDADIGVAA